MVGALSSGSIYNYNELELGKEVGRGGFAVVYFGVLHGRKVAVKQLLSEDDVKAGTETFSDYFAEFRREVWLMSRMQHRYVVKLLGIVKDPLCMIMEFCGGGNLYQWYHKQDGSNFDEEGMKLREKFCLDIAKGMEFMHSTNPPIIHRDLKTPNGTLTIKHSICSTSS